MRLVFGLSNKQGAGARDGKKTVSSQALESNLATCDGWIRTRTACAICEHRVAKRQSCHDPGIGSEASIQLGSRRQEVDSHADASLNHSTGITLNRAPIPLQMPPPRS
jgi:hypothetical protein